jgi:hypothetical protein
MLELAVGAALTALGTAVIGMFIWAVQINADVQVTDQRIEDLLVLINSRFTDISDRLKRIERHVLNGSYHQDDDQ